MRASQSFDSAARTRDGIFNRDADCVAVLYFFDPEEGFCQLGFFNLGVWEQTGPQLFRHVGELDCAA